MRNLRSMLVTGGAGFIGANFIRHVLTHDQQVHITNIDKLTYAANEANLQGLPQDRYRFIHGDITDFECVQRSLETYQIDTIVHFAAESHVDRSIASPVIFVDTNVVGTLVLLECAKQYWLDQKKLSHEDCRFHHISTDEVFGSLSHTDTASTEKTAYRPRSPYAASKASSDHLVQSYFHTFGLPITMSNCSNNYGPLQHSEKFIPTVINACIHQRPIPVYGDGKNIRDWLFVEDHCRGILSILTHGKVGESYNMGGNNEWENLAIAHFICETFDAFNIHSSSTKSLITFVNDRPGHDFRYAIDSSKIQRELGWSPKESFESGLRKTIQYYLSQSRK